MDMRCNGCGGVISSKDECNKVFLAMLSLEFENPAYFAVHNLLVPCYYLQHNLYSNEGWFAARKLVKNFVDGAGTIQSVRINGQRNYNGANKKFQMTEGPQFIEFSKINWPMTILSIRTDAADNYCNDVRRWASSILEDSFKAGV